MPRRNSGTLPKQKTPRKKPPHFARRRKTFLRRLDELILEAGSENAFSRRTGIARGTITAWREGGPKGPTADALLAIAGAFDCTVDWLLWDDSRAKRDRASSHFTEAAFLEELKGRVERALEQRLRFEGFDVDPWRILEQAVEREEESVATRYSWLLGLRSLRTIEDAHATQIPGATLAENDVFFQILRNHLEAGRSA